jgi:hypothetical protein
MKEAHEEPGIMCYMTVNLGLDERTGLDTKDCPLARDNQIWLSGKQISMQTCPMDNQIFCFFVEI